MLGIMPAAIAIETTSEQKRKLRHIVTAKTSSQRDVFGPRIILGLAKDWRDRKQARYRVRITNHTTLPPHQLSFQLTRGTSNTTPPWGLSGETFKVGAFDAFF